MFQTDQATAASTLPAPAAAGTQGYFTNGNPASGVAATIVDADWLNMIQQELINIVTGAGITPSKTTYNQVLSAIKRIGQSTVVLADTGAVNAYSATNSVPLVAGTWVNGVVQQIAVAHTNNGASTYAPDGLPPIPIYGLGLQPLQQNEMFAGGTAILMKQTIPGVNGGNPICVLLECSGGAQQLPSGSYGITPQQFDSSAKLATTAFVKAAGLQFATTANVSASRNLVATDVGAKLIFQGNFTLTIPTPQSIGAQPGNAVVISAYGANTGTAAFSGTTYAYGSAGQSASLTVKSGENLMLIAESATTWQVGPSTAGLGNIGSFAASGLANGYAKLPSGIIFQWGVSSFSTSGLGVTFPIAFPTGVFAVTTGNNISNGVFSSALSVSLQGFNGYLNTGANGQCYWIAIGN